MVSFNKSTVSCYAVYCYKIGSISTNLIIIKLSVWTITQINIEIKLKLCAQLYEKYCYLSDAISFE